MAAQPEDDLCLDFLGTGTSTDSQSRNEKLITYDHFVSWAARAEAASQEQARELLDRARKDPGAAQSALTAVRQMRELVRRALVLGAAGEAPSARDMADLNAVYSKYMMYSSVEWHGGRFGIDFVRRDASLDWLLSRILWSALGLLTGREGKLRRLKVCANAGCGRLFFDTSRNRSRRWCDMRSCGNREKARRFQSRKKAAAGALQQRRRGGPPQAARKRYTGGAEVEIGTDD